jgi:hypothetical protein
MAFARRRLSAYIAKRAPRPVEVQWFNERAHPYVDPVFWAVPHLRGAVVDHPRDGTMRVRVGQGDDQLVETVAHEISTWGSRGRRAPSTTHGRNATLNSSAAKVLADWHHADKGVVDLRRRAR